jgi:hypothetical protein
MRYFRVSYTMPLYLFESFSKMIDQTPARGVLLAIELQRQMIEDDLSSKRSLILKEAASILDFCGFIEVARAGLNTFLTCAVPADHVVFYRKIVGRLIEAGELPSYAKKQFDAAFSENFLKALAA